MVDHDSARRTRSRKGRGGPAGPAPKRSAAPTDGAGLDDRHRDTKHRAGHRLGRAKGADAPDTTTPAGAGAQAPAGDPEHDAHLGEWSEGSHPPAELEALWERFRSDRDEGSRNQLIVHYAPLAKFAAHRVLVGVPPQVELSDLVSYGFIGLIDAIDRYDPARGVSFESYAVRRIRGAILDELRALDWAPRSLRRRARAVQSAEAELHALLQRTPGDEDLALHLGVDVGTVRATARDVARVGFAPIEEAAELEHEGVDGPGSSADPAHIIAARIRQRTLLRELRRCPRRARTVLSLYYFEGLTMGEIAEVLDLSEARVSQIHAESVLRLREALAQELPGSITVS